MRLKSILTLSAFAFVAVASAQVRITEWMYNGLSGTANTTSSEFVEITNLGAAPVDMAGWLMDDDSRNADPTLSTSLAGLGTLAPGQSGLITEAVAADFRALWGLGAGVAIVGSSRIATPCP